MGQRLAIGIDLGGTYIKAGLINERGDSLGAWKGPTQASGGPGVVMDNLLTTTRMILQSQQLRRCQSEQETRLVGVGIGSPGIIDAQAGVVRMATSNLPGWEGVQIGPIFEKEFCLPAFLDNDANAYVWGEYHFGAGQGRRLKSLVGLTLGTGVGGGVVLDGKILHGAHGCAGELGHIAVSDRPDAPASSAGVPGCLESYASAPAIVQYCLAQRPSYSESLIWQLAGEGPVTTEVIHQAALQRDPLALKVMERTATYLGMGVASLVVCFDPDVVVIGGGVSNLGELLLEKVRKVVQERVYFSALCIPQIVRGQLGSDAGYKGAAALALFPCL